MQHPNKKERPMQKEQVTVTVIIKSETGKAYKVEDVPGHCVWVPKSQCNVERTHGKDEHSAAVDMSMPEWLAYDKELI
jgi:hypothetical protein